MITSITRPNANGEIRSLNEGEIFPLHGVTTRQENEAISSLKKPASSRSENEKNIRRQKRAKRKIKQLIDRWIQITLTKGVSGLQEEFASLAGTVDPALIRVFLQNSSTGRNRYRDVGCLDSTRVVLNTKCSSANTYIHANYVSTPYKEKRFICTQAPLPTTVYDFWQMVLQNGSCVVVMLCGIKENENSTCFEYWPQKAGTSVRFDDITVKTVVIKTMKLHSECSGKITIRISGLAIMVNDVFAQAVDHFQWVDWPDRRVPPADLTPICLLNYIRKSRAPIVIHCTAGIGRAGAIIMMAHILETLAKGAKPRNSCEILKRLRRERAYLIHSDLQYLYVHRVLLEYFALKGVISNYLADRVAAFIDDYERTVA
uniref:Tyrosine-protein phosphatase domain-containing protein n=1 Tax=Parascaris univalens TaxID=6257 RepID=A0A915ALB4_PARUN